MVLLPEQYKKGLDAFQDGISRTDNPFYESSGNGVGTLNAISWWEGWDAAAYIQGIHSQPEKEVDDIE